MPNPIAQHLTSGRKTVSVAGTAEALSTQGVRVRKIVIQPLRANTNPVAVGGPDVIAASGSSQKGTLLSGQTDRVTLEGPELRLTEIFVDAQTNGEGVAFSYTTL